MSVRVVHVGLSLPRRGRPRTIREVVVSFQPNTLTELRRAARQTHLAVGTFIQEVIEADLATRRLTNPPLPGVKTRECAP